MLIALHKPYGVLSTFTGAKGQRTLADVVSIPSVYAAGRLDADSEGLLLLTDDGALQNAIASPAIGLVKRYLAQVEGSPDDDALRRLREGVEVRIDGSTHRAIARDAKAIDAPALEARDPPVRVRAAIPTAWIEIALTEGRNRQVRRMTAAVGHPTLRLVRVGIGDVDLFTLQLAPGEWRAIDPATIGVSRMGSMKHADTQKQASPRPRRSTSHPRRRYQQ